MHALSWLYLLIVMLLLGLRTWAGHLWAECVVFWGSCCSRGLWETTHQLVSPHVPSAGLYQYGWGLVSCNQAQPHQQHPPPVVGWCIFVSQSAVIGRVFTWM